MRKLLCLGVAVLVVLGFLYAQQVQVRFIQESVLLRKMFTKVAEGLAYSHSDRSKTTAVAVKKTKDGTWYVTAQHKVDRDFPQSSVIDIKVERTRESEVYVSSEIIVPDERELDLLLFFVPGLKAKHIFKEFKAPYRYEETWVFGFRGGAGKVPGSPGYVTAYFADYRYFFSSASIWFGNSGSPVLNREGEVLGLAVRMAENSTDSLFISGKRVKEFIDKALKERK